MERTDAVVIGAGVVGLAVARALAQAGREVIVLEAESAIGTGTSSRNSEVIHAGIYYPTGSLKAKLCVAGRKQLVAYCAVRGISAPLIGKLMVATAQDQIPKLEQLLATAHANGVPEVVRITARQARTMEPDVQCIVALHSPVTGVLDSHAYMLSLQGELEEAGGMIALNAPVLSGEAAGAGFMLEVGGDAPMSLACTTLVNAAGHGAPAIATTLAGLDPAHVPQAWFAKGHYFALSGVKSPFRQLIYPMPEQAGLGIHATIDLGGQVKFGPDVEWVDGLDYAADERRADSFYASIRQYWPALPDGALTPSYTGIRPKIVGPGEPAADFRIDGPERHGLAGLVNLFGIESPGLTSSLAIADEVMARLDGAS